ncbi:radical SAM protein [Hydrocarboniphaga sp.]|uniref:radical SAM protein n=1 Tax=Hydrocarboniphaga sp. TaxID=2033016 RepID=UPI003D0D4A72
MIANTRHPAAAAALVPPPATRPLSICLINPRFEPSHFGNEHALALHPGDKRCQMITGALPTLAGLVPDGHHVELLDENVEPIDFDALARFDVIGVTGMIVQRARMQQILLRLQSVPALIAVGGPYISVEETFFDGLCDVRFVGEAETTWPQFLRDLAAGRPTLARYEQLERTDMSTLPLPRFDLVKSQHYLMAPLQFSRGCPFLCEFCDIIVIFGRKPRLKTAEQVIAELEAIKKAGFKLCFVVDDNFIGNKVEAKKLLPRVIQWQRDNAYPLILSTEASINLGDDAELLELMVQANFRHVFIGIESPRAESLKEMRKTHNLRGDSMLDKLRRVRDAGLVIEGGFMVGFDNDDAAIFDEQFEFIQLSGIGLALVSKLTPIPSTPLYARLKAEGRLDFSDPECLFLPKQMTRDQLKQGQRELIRRLAEPENFFGRVIAGYSESGKFRRHRAQMSAQMPAASLRQRLSQAVGVLITLSRLARVLAAHRLLRRFAMTYVGLYRGQRRQLGKQAIGLGGFVGLCALHWHHYRVAHDAVDHWGAALPREALPMPAEERRQAA